MGIDYCTQCHGLRLDRGELDEIIERSGSSQSVRTYRGWSHQEREYRRKKHKSFLGELFDF
jgi:hypothetical protein